MFLRARVVATVTALLAMIGCAPTAPVPGATETTTGSPGLPSVPPSVPAPRSSDVATAGDCSAEVAALSLRQRAGQLVMVGVTGGLDTTERRAITASRAGAVILMGNSHAGVAGVAKLAKAIQAAGGGSVLIATDQEGGLVQRLYGSGFATIPSAARQARLSDAELTAQAQKWGRALASAGVLLNLAPVADVVPASNRSANRPIAGLGRGYGSDAVVVSAKVTAVRAGYTTAGVATAVKHFPGLGAVKGNTDFVAKVIDRTTTADSPLLKPFRDAVATDVDAVMVSSAIYTQLDAKRPALFSPTVIGLLRGWGYDGVVISDDLGVAVAARSVSASKRAARFVQAGGDIAITVDPSKAKAFTSGVIARAKTDPVFAQKVAQAAARVLRLKKSLGLVNCG